MRTVNLTETTRQEKTFVEQISKQAKVNLHDCYQCGKCSAGCPMAEAMDLPPQQIMRLLQMGKVQQVLEAESPGFAPNVIPALHAARKKIDTASQ